jgi:type VI secretion system secreted protein VgrG
MSTVYTQKNRPLAIETPLGEDKLLLAGFRGEEQISRLFSYELDLLSDDEAIDPKKIVGKQVSFMVRRADGEPRWFHGHVRRFGYLGTGDRLSRYRAEVVPNLWFLTQTTDCRIFQNKNVKDIISQVFDDLGLTDYDLSGVSGQHDTWDYCVQYRETDFNFVSRLMEKEGIFYYFKHEKGKHTLKLADSKSGYFDCDEDQLEFVGNASLGDVYNNLVSWQHFYEFKTGKVAQTDYDFINPSTSLKTDTSTLMKFEGVDKYEQYDYPGEYLDKGLGENETNIRMEEQEAQHNLAGGESYVRSLTPGARFTLAEHPSDAEKGQKYVVIRIRHEAELGGAFTARRNAGAAEFIYKNDFRCIPASTTFRPDRLTLKPRVHGSQTAVVVGPSGEEIYTDEYGRVKVQFHWDREGKKDENSSCWVRVSQPWTGHRWGWQHIPRMGSEVVVSFLEGDPDRPYITGMVYNAESMPPYTLPDNKTQTGLKTRSSKNGTDENFNEIRFEDLKGEEQLYIHAEKNQDIEVENDETHWVGHDRTKTIDRDETVHVKRDRTETVDRDETITVQRNRTETVAQDESITIGGSRTETVGSSETITIASSRTETVGGSDTVTVAQSITLTAGVSINFIAGAASITLMSSGDIIISGTNIVINGKTSASMTSSGPLLVKGMPTVIN